MYQTLKMTGALIALAALTACSSFDQRPAFRRAPHRKFTLGSTRNCAELV